MPEEGFKEGAVPGENDSGDQTREGEQGEREDRRLKLGGHCKQTSKEDDDEPLGEESLSDHLAHPHLGYIIAFKL